MARFYTPSEVAEARVDLFSEQSGLCAICDRPLDAKGVPDHCHQSGLIRGLLCRQCNAGLGMFGESVNSLLAAITYLKRADRILAGLTPDERRRRGEWQRDRQVRSAMLRDTVQERDGT